MSRNWIAAPWIAAALLSAAMAQAGTAAREGNVVVEKNVTIHYVEAGDRNAATTILFVPGWATTTAVWRDQITAFASQARVVAVDPRSQGFSTITTGANTPERRAQDVREVIRSLSLSNVVLVGWSQGVQDVAAYASAFEGEQVAGYVLVDSVLGAGAAAAVANPDSLKRLLERLGIYERHPREYLRGMMTAIIRTPEGRTRVDELVELGLRTPPDIGISMLLMDFVIVDRRPALSKFNRPTLVIAAADSDELEAQRSMAREISGARFEIVEQAGHAVFIDQPARFNRLLADFVSVVRGKRTAP